MATTQFDHNDRTLGEKQGERLEQLHRECPVGYSTLYGGFWHIAKYQDVVSVARDWQTFTTAEGLLIPPSGAVKIVPPEIEPPEHTAYRKMLMAHFSPGAVAGYEPLVRDVVHSTMDLFADRGRADLARDFAVPIPAMVIAGVLGLERENWEEIRILGEGFLNAQVTEDMEAKITASKALESWLQERIDTRYGRDGTDRLSQIVNATVDGARIPPERVLGMIQVIVMAGHETTIHSIASMLYRIATTPGVRERLLADRSLISATCDESLRLDSPVLCLGRTVTHDVEFAGHSMSADDKVAVLYGAANRDADKFPNPHEFDIDRDARGHVAFGSGRHRCLGEHLALLEMRVALEAVLDRIPDYRVDPDGAVQWMSGGVSVGVSSFPALFTPAHVTHEETRP